VNEEKSTAERLKEAQAKVKALASTRDQIIHAAGAEESKLKEAYNKLTELV
jgi:hypothetical protein